LNFQVEPNEEMQIIMADVYPSNHKTIDCTFKN